MKILDEEIARIDKELDRLQTEKTALLRLKFRMDGEPLAAEQTPQRKRAANIKPKVLDIMWQAASDGATTAEVAALVKESAPAVTKDTVGSILSRLKADGALTYDGVKYYDKRFAPNRPFEGLKVVND